MENITIEKANNLQNITERYVKQNISIETAVTALKNITHAPLAGIPNYQKFINQNDYFGVTDMDRKKINEFIDWLSSLKMPLGELFRTITND